MTLQAFEQNLENIHGRKRQNFIIFLALTSKFLKPIFHAWNNNQNSEKCVLIAVFFRPEF